MALKSEFYTRKKFNTPTLAKTLIEMLLSHQDFAPNAYGSYEPLRKFALADIHRASEILANEAGQKLKPNRIYSSLIFQRRKHEPKISYYLEWSDLPHRPFDRNSVKIGGEILLQKDRFVKWQSFLMDLCVTFESWYAYCGLEEEMNQKHLLNWYVKEQSGIKVETHRGAGYDLYEGIPGVYWGNYFGPFLVSWFGREKFLDLPCYALHWLDTGGVFFTTAEFPDQWNTPRSLAYQEAIKAHLGRDYFFDIMVVKRVLDALHAIPHNIKPEQLQGNRKAPVYPFEVVKPSSEIDFEEMERHFLALGYRLIQRETTAIILQNEAGEKVRITNVPSPSIEFFPNV